MQTYFYIFSLIYLFSFFMVIPNVLLFYPLSLYALHCISLLPHCASCLTFFASVSLSLGQYLSLICCLKELHLFWLVLNCVLLSDFSSLKVLDEFLNYKWVSYPTLWYEAGSENGLIWTPGVKSDGPASINVNQCENTTAYYCQMISHNQNQNPNTIYISSSLNKESNAPLAHWLRSLKKYLYLYPKSLNILIKMFQIF